MREYFAHLEKLMREAYAAGERSFPSSTSRACAARAAVAGDAFCRVHVM
jgi:hypothetical protein